MTLRAVDALLERLGVTSAGAPGGRDYDELRWRAYQEKAAERGLL